MVRRCDEHCIGVVQGERGPHPRGNPAWPFPTSPHFHAHPCLVLRVKQVGPKQRHFLLSQEPRRGHEAGGRVASFSL